MISFNNLKNPSAIGRCRLYLQALEDPSRQKPTTLVHHSVHRPRRKIILIPGTISRGPDQRMHPVERRQIPLLMQAPLKLMQAPLNQEMLEFINLGSPGNGAHQKFRLQKNSNHLLGRMLHTRSGPIASRTTFARRTSIGRTSSMRLRLRRLRSRRVR